MPDQSIELIADLKLQKPTTAERQIREIERNLFKGSGRAGEPLGRLTGKVSEFDKSLEAANARVLAFGASAAIITTVTTALTQMVVQSIRVEKVLLDINVLLGQSSSSLSAFSDSLFEVAKNTGQSFFDVAEAAKEFSRQGLGVQETLSRTADAMILTRLTGLDLVKSVEQLTASVNQFSKEGITTADVINRLANVDAKFAVSAKDLSEGLSRAGSVAQDAGASFNELIALVTAVQQRTARGGAVIGNALKTIFTRVSRSDTLDSLEKLGIGVRDLEGNTLPAIRILSELSQKYDAMSSSQRAFTSELVGGGYQINIVKSLFDDLGRTVPEYAKALDVAGRSTDEAYQRNELLNKSFASLANEAGQNLTKLAASFGSLTFGPALKNIFSVINGAGDSIDGNSFLEAGAKVGKGLITGIGDFIGGPGLIYLIALIGKLGKKFGTFAKDSLTDVLSIGAPNAKILDTQKGIVDLVNNEARAHDIVNNALLTQVQKEQQLILLIKEKVAAQAAFKNETLALSTSLVGRGVAFKPSTGQFKTKAGGHMPLPISSVPQEAIQREIVGAKQAGYNIRASDVRVMRASIDGKSTTVVYNNKEKVIHDYMGSGEPAIIPPTGRISNYAGGVAKYSPKLSGTLGPLEADALANKAFNASVRILSKEMGIPVDKIASTVISNSKFRGSVGYYQQDSNIIKVSSPRLQELDDINRAQYPELRKSGYVNSLGKTSGGIISHEYFHNAFRTNKKAALGFAKENDFFIPRDAKTALEYLEKVKRYSNPAKEYKGYAVEEALATQFGKVIGFTQHAGGHMPDYKNFAAVPKVPKTIYRGVNSKYGDSNRGAGSLGIANKLVATIGKGNYSDNKGIAKVFGDKTISQNTSKIKPSEVLQMSSYADVVGLYKKYEQRLPAGLASVIKNTTGAEQLGHIQNAGAQLASVLKEDGYKMISAPLAAGDANVLGKRGLQGQMYIPLAGGYINAPGGLSNPLNSQRNLIRLPKGFEAKKNDPKTLREKLEDAYARANGAAQKVAIKATPYAGYADDAIGFVRTMLGFSGGYMNAALGLPLQTYSREDLLGTAKKLGVKFPPQIRNGSESQIARFIGDSRQYKSSISRERRAADKAGIPYSGVGNSPLATTNGFNAQSRLFEPITQTKTLTALEAKIKAENAFGLNPGYQKAQDGRYRTISAAQEALGQSESANPSQTGQRSQQEQEQRNLRAAQMREARLQKTRQDSIARARANIASRRANALTPQQIAQAVASATAQARPLTGLGAPLQPPVQLGTPQARSAKSTRIRTERASFLTPSQTEQMRAESGVGFRTRTGPEAIRNRNVYANSVPGIAENLRVQGIVNPISSTYQQFPLFRPGAFSVPTGTQAGQGGSSGGGPPIVPVGGVASSGGSPQKRSLLSRATSFRNPEHNARFSSGAFALSFAAPLIGGVAAETFGSKDPTDQRSNRKIQSIASGVGTGAAIGAIVGGPLGAGIALAVAGFTSLKAVLDNSVLSFDDLNEKSKIQAEASQKIIAGIAGYTNALETLQNESLDPNQRKSVERQGQKSLSQLSLEQQQELINAGDDFKKIQDINSKIQEDANKKEAGLQLPTLVSSIRTGGYKDGGLGSGVLLNTILQAGKPSEEVDRKELDARLGKLKETSATAALETEGYVRRGRTTQLAKNGETPDFQLPSRKAIEAKSQLEGLRAGVLETLGLKTADIAEFSRQIGEASEEQRREFDKLILSAGKGLDNKESLKKLSAKIVEAQKDISKRLTDIRRGLNTESLAGQRASELDSIKKDGSRGRASSASDLAFSTIRSRLSDAEPYLSAPTSIRLQSESDIAQKTDATNREITKLNEEKNKAIAGSLPETKRILSEIPDAIIKRINDREKAVGLVKEVGKAQTSTGALKSIDDFKKLIVDSTDPETQAFYEKLLELSEKQKDALEGISKKTDKTIDELRKNLEQDKTNAKFEAREKLNRKVNETSRRQFSSKELAANGPQFAGIQATALNSVKDGLAARYSSTDPAKLRTQALRYANGPEDRNAKIAAYQDEDLRKAIESASNLEQEFNSGVLLSPEEIARTRQDRGQKTPEERAKQAERAVYDKYSKEYQNSTAAQDKEKSNIDSQNRIINENSEKNLKERTPLVRAWLDSDDPRLKESLWSDVENFDKKIGYEVTGMTQEESSENYKKSRQISYTPSKIQKPNVNRISLEANAAATKELQAGYGDEFTSTEEERKKKLDRLINAKQRIGAQGITATYGAKLSPFLTALDQGSYNTGSSFVNPGSGGSIAAQIKSGQFGQVQDRLAKLYPTLNTQGQAQIKDLIPSLQSGAIQLKGNAEKQRREAEAIAGEESKPITIKFDESAKKLIESLAPKENKTPDVTNTITVSVAGDATKETADKIVEGVKYELDAVVAFLSKNDGFAIPPKVTS